MTQGTLQVCDLGMGRFVRANTRLTPRVVTLAYRAPEILFDRCVSATALFGIVALHLSCGCFIELQFVRAAVMDSQAMCGHVYAL